jgi:hypothetical protein
MTTTSSQPPTDPPTTPAPTPTSSGTRLPVIATVLFLAMALAGGVVLGESLGLWKLPADQANPGVYLLIAVGIVALAALLLFSRRLMASLHPPLYVALVLVLAVWLVLSFGVTQLGWALLPPS